MASFASERTWGKRLRSLFGAGSFPSPCPIRQKGDTQVDGEVLDAIAIYYDFLAVGNSLWDAIEKVQDELQPEQQKEALAFFGRDHQS